MSAWLWTSILIFESVLDPQNILAAHCQRRVSFLLGSAKPTAATTIEQAVALCGLDSHGVKLTVGS